MTIRKNIIFWVIVIIYLSISLSFISEKKGNVLCSKVNVSILDSAGNRFVKETDVKQFIHDQQSQIMGSPIIEINTDELEKLILDNPNIKTSEVYVNVKGELCIDIDQRNPIVRVFAKNGFNFYIDKDGYIMPLSDKYASHVVIANGNIIARPDLSRKMNVMDVVTGKENSSLIDLYNIAKYIYTDDFWVNQIEQIYVNVNNDFEIIPRVGAHQIILGSAKHYDKKLRYLKAFYEQALNNIGWNEYEKINLKYENQIVCSKR